MGKELPDTLGGRAEENLRYIRGAMERAASFTSVPGWGILAMGTMAVATALATAGIHSGARWLAVWVAVAAAAFGVGVATTAIKARQTGIPLFGGAGARFWVGLLPPLVAGALLTAPLARAGFTSLLPAVWMLVYGAGVTTAGAHSIRLVPVMGMCFMGAGALALLFPMPAARDVVMAAGFGGLHVVFGYIIARRHGG